MHWSNFVHLLINIFVDEQLLGAPEMLVLNLQIPLHVLIPVLLPNSNILNGIHILLLIRISFPFRPMVVDFLEAEWLNSCSLRGRRLRRELPMRRIRWIAWGK
jgi:hypothetical protein